jgi:hypothetical protein
MIIGESDRPVRQHTREILFVVSRKQALQSPIRPRPCLSRSHDTSPNRPAFPLLLVRLALKRLLALLALETTEINRRISAGERSRSGDTSIGSPPYRLEIQHIDSKNKRTLALVVLSGGSHTVMLTCLNQESMVLINELGSQTTGAVLARDGDLGQGGNK